MSYKIDNILTILEEILTRLAAIEKHYGVKKQPQKTIDKPKLTVVTSNIIEFNKND